MLPSIFGENLFDDFFTDPFGMMVMPQRHDPLYGKHSKNLMKTDVRETEDSYELDVDLPGFKKDEVNVELKNGYLTIQAAKGLDKDETDKKGTVDAVDYGAEVALTLSLPEDAPRRLQDRLAELSAGRLRLELGETQLHPGPREEI